MDDAWPSSESTTERQYGRARAAMRREIEEPKEDLDYGDLSTRWHEEKVQVQGDRTTHSRLR